MATAEWQSAKQKVASWIDNEERCVTAQRVSQTLNLSRSEASRLLEEFWSENNKNGSKFQITTCQKEQKEEDTVRVTVFRLRQSTTVSGDSDTNNTIVALAPLQATESIATAHERDMVEWREMISDGRYRQQTNDDGAIQSADAIAPLKDAPASNGAKIPALNDDDSSSAPAASTNLSSNRHKAFSGKDKKVTTAASFFGSTSKPKNGSNGSPAKSSNVAPNSKANTTTATNKNNQRPPQPTPAKENKVRTNQVAPAPTKASTSTSSSSTIKSAKSVGNADDFVADEEDSDDEEQNVQQVRKQKRAARRKAVQEANKQSEETPVDEAGDDDDDNSKAKVVGAMDAFATAATKKTTVESNNNGTRQRKRRKKLVEETVTVNGYLRTETKAIWEDVPTDEEEEEKEQERKRVSHNKKPSKPNKPQQGMKQKSLMGFFAKK